RFRSAAKRLFGANLRSVSAAAVSSPVMDILGAVAIAMLLWLGRNEIKDSVFNRGPFPAFIVAGCQLNETVRESAQFWNNFQQARGASSEIFAIMDEQDEVKEKPGATILPPFTTSVKFDDVRFCYDDDPARCILQGLNLEVKRGEVVALVGSSGA